MEFLFRRAHSRSCMECKYWSGWRLSPLTASSNEVTVETTGPNGTGLPQFGLPLLPILHLHFVCSPLFRSASNQLGARQVREALPGNRRIQSVETIHPCDAASPKPFNPISVRAAVNALTARPSTASNWRPSSILGHPALLATHDGSRTTCWQIVIEGLFDSAHSQASVGASA